MWASLDLPSRTPQRTQAQTPASSPHETQPARPPLPQPTSVFTVAHLASYHLTSFPRPVIWISVPGCCCCYCSATVASGKSGQFLPAVGASSAARSRASQSVTTLLLLGRAKEELPGSPHTLQLDHSSPIARNDRSPVALHHRTRRVVHTCTDLFSTQPAQHTGSSTLLSSCAPVSVICCRCTTCSNPALTLS